MAESKGCKIIIVEGNISAGKSTLCRKLSHELNYVLYLEPTVENPFLEPYYKEPKKYALPMQLWLLKQRFITYVRALKYAMDPSTTLQGVILDRSIFSDIVFAEKNFKDGNFTREGYDYYLRLRAQMLEALPEPHVVVYLDVDPEECFNRIHKMRQRSCEDGIPLEYLSGLDECYHNFVSEMRKTRASVFEIGWNSFGSDAPITRAIAAVDAVPLESWSSDTHHLNEFLDDDEALAKAMTLDFVIDEAKGADVEVADPDFVTTREARVMPPSPKTAAAMVAEADAEADAMIEDETKATEGASAGAGAGGPGKRAADDAFSPEPRARTKARTGASPPRPSPTTVAVEGF
mmetsp:Transcript_14886/g.51840  ORF Transcript_14886/g.51840 Transcript_14886/m.51840 type:complete len:348 (-) Transcript_14886:39-1082(-)|eukprot:CAMPEP_0203806666 /NCGR_PEP_ID=MMETSP0115-20131106/618_1 /ASSEMBLY_ACC=CAM_ASM_000227 /TAXON_ID=33651 /ORGANISM="Bicosoecid sp, Strain ms1" /LENGTH=347 /DNA_ID=CAMNT_0050715329 /DNA_START=53 /DNA_END=1096 /DNA_ORIENTATION=+